MLSKIKVELNLLRSWGLKVNNCGSCSQRTTAHNNITIRLALRKERKRYVVVQSFSLLRRPHVSDLLCSRLVLGVGFLCSRRVLGSRVGTREHRMKRSPNSRAHFGKVVYLKLRSVELTGSSPLLPVVGPVEGVEERCIPPPGCPRSGVMLAAAIWGEGADI